MPFPVSRDKIALVRSFNRFFTRHIGVLGENLLRPRSP